MVLAASPVTTFSDSLRSSSIVVVGGGNVDCLPPWCLCFSRNFWNESYVRFVRKDSWLILEGQHTLRIRDSQLQ